MNDKMEIINVFYGTFLQIILYIPVSGLMLFILIFKYLTDFVVVINFILRWDKSFCIVVIMDLVSILFLFLLMLFPFLFGEFVSSSCYI